MKMDLRNIVFEVFGVGWIHLAQNRVLRRALMDTAPHFRVV
jgi:hypothetical protein